MTAPDTNIERQVKRHYPALFGIAAVLVAIVGFVFLATLAPDDDATPPATAPTPAVSE